MRPLSTRTTLIVSLELAAFIASIVIIALWISNPSGPFEPYLAATGIALVFTEAIRRYEGKLFSVEGVERTPSERIHHHDFLREKFKEEINRCRSEDLQKDVIIHHVNRLDDYPNNKERPGISPWFKVGLLDTYHLGIVVGLGWHGLISTPHGLRKVDYKLGEAGQINAMLTAEIPYDFIESMNIDGDEYYYLPHIFCHFSNHGEPYQRMYYAKEVNIANHISYWKEIASKSEVDRNSIPKNKNHLREAFNRANGHPLIKTPAPSCTCSLIAMPSRTLIDTVQNASN